MYFLMPFSSSKLSSNQCDIQPNKSTVKQRFLSFNTSMGQANAVKRSPNDIQAFLDKEKEKFIERYENPMRQNAQLEDFDLIRTVGTGSFGKRIEKKNKRVTRLKILILFCLFKVEYF